jgi:hypothetical protein
VVTFESEDSAGPSITGYAHSKSTSGFTFRLQAANATQNTGPVDPTSFMFIVTGF